MTVPGSTRFSALGGHRVLDLINTVDWRLDPARRGERLADIAAVWDWGLEFGYLTVDEHDRLTAERSAASTDAWEGILGLREQTYEVLFDEPTSDRARQRLDETFREALDACVLTRTASGWAQLETDLYITTLHHRIVRDVMAFATTTPADRLRQCSDDACGWVYLDTSPRLNRLWCSSASCGNRNRARRHYQRSRS